MRLPNRSAGNVVSSFADRELNHRKGKCSSSGVVVKSSITWGGFEGDAYVELAVGS